MTWTPDAAAMAAVLELPGTLVVVVGEERRIVAVSPTAVTLLGRPAADLIGASIDDLVHPDDESAGRALTHVLGGAARTDAVTVRLRGVDGGWRWFDGAARSHTDDGGALRAVLLLIDASQRVAAMQATEERFRLIAQQSEDIIVVLDGAGAITWASDAAERRLGHRPAGLIGQSALDFIHPDDRPGAIIELASIAANRPATSPVVRIRHADGGYERVEITSTNLLDQPAVQGIVMDLRIVTARVEAEERLQSAAREMERVTRVLGATSDLVAITSRDGKLLYVNDAFCEFFGVKRDALEDFSFVPVTPRWARDAYVSDGVPALRGEGIWRADFAYYRDGVEVPMSALFMAHRDEDGRLEFISSITRDMSDQKELEAQLAHQATHDSLTGLANRALLLDRLELALARSARSGRTVGLIFVDLDNFKDVNDTHGHRGGDQALVTISRRLRHVVRPSDTVARFGGDEFVVLCDDLEVAADGESIAQRIGEALREPIDIEGGALVVTGSAGVAFTAGGGNAEALLRTADAAMYRAKAGGRDRVVVA
jgi:diguanylate cyclase (GGDEF)-like protein/PAS domain S-box-containing protein